MKIFIVVMVSVLSSMSLADGQKDLSNFQTMDLKQFEGLNNANSQNSNKIKFSVTCKTDDGREINADHPEYQSCMAKAQNKTKK